jgi:hypothetical protein
VLTYHLDDIQNRGIKPRVHGNGFVQLDLSQQVRLHVWGDPTIPKQSVDTPIHDHMFSFRSYVLMGKLLNRQFMWMTSRDVYDQVHATHMVHRAQVREKEDTVLGPTGETGRLVMESEHVVTESYTMTPFAIHESVPMGVAVTVIVKDGKTLAQGGCSPRVFVPIGVNPDNDFNRYAFEDKVIWDLIFRIAGRRIEVPHVESRHATAAA